MAGGVEYVNLHEVNPDTVIYQRAGAKKGTWHYRLALGGAYVRKTTGTTDRQRAILIALEAWRKACVRIDTGRPVVSKTMGEVARACVEHWERKELSKSRRYAYINQTRKHIIPFFDTMRIDEVRDEDVSAFAEYLAGDFDLSASSINNYLSTLSLIFQWAVGKRFVAKAALPEIKRLSLNAQTERGAFTEGSDEEEGEMDKILHHLIEKWHSDRDVYHDLFHYVLLIYATGLRPSSVMRLRVGDVLRRPRRAGDDTDPDASPGFVVRATTFKGKGSRTREIVPRPSITWDWLGYVDGREPVEPLFPHTAPHYGRLFREVLSTLNLSKDHHGRPRSLYSLRHTYITHMLRLGADSLMVAKNTMTSVQMIERHYERIAPNHMYEQMARYD